MLLQNLKSLKLSEMNIGLSLQAACSLFHPCKDVLLFLELKVGGTKHEKNCDCLLVKESKRPENLVQVLGKGQIFL